MFVKKAIPNVAHLLVITTKLKVQGRKTTKKMVASIEFEQITVRVPKALMAFIRRFYGDPKRYLEHDIVNWVRVDLEVLTGKELAEQFNLQPIFQAILGETIQ